MRKEEKSELCFFWNKQKGERENREFITRLQEKEVEDIQTPSNQCLNARRFVRKRLRQGNKLLKRRSDKSRYSKRRRSQERKTRSIRQ